MTADPTDVRTRMMEAAISCAREHGVRGFSLEDVALEAGLSRSTIYRYFPEGRSQLFEETVTWEIGRFWERLAVAVEGYPTLEDRLVAGLVIGRKLMAKSSILNNLRDPELLDLVEAAQPAEPLVHGVIREYMVGLLEEERAAGRMDDSVDLDFAADYLMRMTISWMNNAAGVDLTDDGRARQVIREQFLAGILR
ncbi:MAG: TetR/AcrR family transcriptional regulator [Microthrixaceae bacterium]